MDSCPPFDMNNASINANKTKSYPISDFFPTWLSVSLYMTNGYAFGTVKLVSTL